MMSIGTKGRLLLQIAFCWLFIHQIQAQIFEGDFIKDQAEKKGTCPIVPPREECPPPGSLNNECLVDSDCPAELKCCTVGCNLQCSVANFTEKTEVCTVPIDLGFLIDVSGSIGEEGFRTIKTFVKNIINAYIIGPEDTHVGAIFYSDDATLLFKFNSFQGTNLTKETLFTEVDGIPGPPKGKTRIDLALRMAERDLFSIDGGVRPDKPKLLLVLTDGRQTFGDNLFPKAEALHVASKPLKESGVHVYSMGIGDDYDIAELLEIATDDASVFRAASFDQLLTVVSTLTENTCKACTKPVDVHFAIDSSDNMDADQFRIVKNFVARLGEKFVISMRGAHLSASVYSDKAEMVFDFYDGIQKKEFLDAVDKMPYLGNSGTNMDLALKLASEEAFQLRGGTRQPVPKVLVLFTTGNCEKCEEKLEKAVEPLNNAGVQLIVVSTGDKINPTELLSIVSYPKDQFIHSAESFEKLINAVFIQKISTLACTSKSGKCSQTTRPFFCPAVITQKCRFDQECPEDQKCCLDGCDRACVPPKLACITPVDVAFAFDSSKSIGSQGFQLMTDFASNLIDSFQFSEKDSHGSAITYGKSSDVVFNFAQFYSPKKLKDELKSIPYKPSETSSLSSALDMALSSVFSVKGRSRRGAPRVLVVLTDGADIPAEEEAEIRRKADLLKNSAFGCEIIVVGIGEKAKNSTILQSLSSEGVSAFGKFFTVDSFQDLTKYKEQLRVSEKICAAKLPQFQCAAIPPSPNCRVIDNECDTDFDCPGTYQCCPDTCRRRCTPTSDDCGSKVDLVLVLDDAEKNTDSESFVKVKEFAKKFISAFDVKETGTHVAAMTFSDTAKVAFDFNDLQSYNLSDIRKAIDKIKYSGGLTSRLDKALTVAHEDILSEVGGSRQSRAQPAIVIITDGNTAKESKPLDIASWPLRGRDVRIIAISIGDQTNEKNLKEVVSLPVTENIFLAANYDDIMINVRELAKQSCQAAIQRPLAPIVFEPGPPGPKGDKGNKGGTGPNGLTGDEGQLGPEGGKGDRGSKGQKGETGLAGPPGGSGGDTKGPDPLADAVGADDPGEGGEGVGIYSLRPGAPGPPGIVGSAGSAGLAGDAGENGPKGQLGRDGPTGPFGERGPAGEPGPNGEDGVIGETGPIGEPGPKGAAGAPGAMGLQGDPGFKGAKGGEGEAGDGGENGRGGSKGYKGMKGLLGDSGASGFPGEAGAEGPGGPIGPSGPRGSSGLAGPPGPVGEDGLPGPTGFTGNKGLKGAQGTAGIRGPKGASGELGAVGDQGVKGPRGLSGEDGPAGGDGDKGLKGEIGRAGPPGQRGAIGVQGVQGPAGADGLDGLRGEFGPMGQRGQSGVKGESGEIGARGNDGPSGSEGARGAKGRPGSPGQPGTLGLTGRQGARGEPGNPGISGFKGESGDVGFLGKIGAKGSRGSPGEIGIKGERGEVGGVGRPGLNGRDGKPGQRGLPGNDGSSGAPGAQGQQGFAGSIGRVGSPGDMGFTGASGNPGLSGNKGESGTRGQSGLPGASGPAGKQGLRGERGASGVQGTRGLQGSSGPLGSAGFDGKPGPDGSKGQRGKTGRPGGLGDIGPVGDQGAAGQPGNPGTPGGRGDDGAPGISGDVGPSGAPGSAGSQGAQGLPGRPGPSGAEGNRGLAGLAGSKGERGADGTPGARGMIGLDGRAGPLGPRGTRGADGKPGNAGQPGRPGEQGPSGPDGLPGRMGPQGILGPRGQPGPTGVKGKAGDIGDEGEAGPDGFIGLPGFAGSIGVEGDSGEKGDTGPIGELGSMGPPGSPGEQGPLGPPGPAGVPGPVGKQGLAGAIGSTGVPGKPGRAGSAGSSGKDGSPGLPGVNGKDGAAGPSGASGRPGMQGPVGTPGNPGSIGRPGLDGPKGYAGKDGADGKDGQRGPTGKAGRPGVSGDSGESGEDGAPGNNGTAGAVGQDGPKGERGDRGRTGTSGMAGSSGADGEPGGDGAAGLDGLRGPAGAAGNKGKDGQTGTRGEQGGRGKSGAKGSFGQKGAKGTMGRPGIFGPVGILGEKGDRGNNGPSGPSGIAGSRGNYGAEGPEGPKGDDGDVGLSGQMGSQGYLGQNGDDGIPGEPGKPGPAGPAGPPGSFGGGMAGDFSGFLSDTGIQKGPVYYRRARRDTTMTSDSAINKRYGFFKKFYNQLLAVDLLQHGNGNIDTPARTCRELFYTSPSKKSDDYFIDPNGGSPFDQFKVFCNRTSFETCIYPKFPMFEKSKWFTGKDTLKWAMQDLEDIPLGFEYAADVDQIKMLQLLSNKAVQNVTYLCRNSHAWTDSDGQFLKNSIKIKVDDESVIDSNSKLRNLDVKIPLDNCKVKDNKFHQAIIQLKTAKTKYLPILDLGAFDIGNINEEFGWELGPVCFS